MHPWTANLIGLLVGCAIGSAALAVILPQADNRIASPEPPRIATLAPGTEPLPNIVYPDRPQADGRGTHAPGTGVAGTGFFVASNGSLLTAAHVVSGCRETRIASELVKPSVARLIASDERQDIALLRAANVAPPATLAVGHPAAPHGRLFVLGYPA